MKTQEFISSLNNIKVDDTERFERLRVGLPLGVDEAGEIVVAHACPNKGRANHLCITGSKREDFIKRLLYTLTRIHEKNGLCILLLSPNPAYAKLLSLKNADITVPYVRSLADVSFALDGVDELLKLRAERGVEKYPRLLLVLDGLEELQTQEDGLLEIYKPFFEKTYGTGVGVITGVDLLKSIFGGYPGAFVGIGNCLITADGEGKTDATFVGEDSSLSLPIALDYPSDLSIEELFAEPNVAKE